jgi:hypothetical protein
MTARVLRQSLEVPHLPRDDIATRARVPCVNHRASGHAHELIGHVGTEVHRGPWYLPFKRATTLEASETILSIAACKARSAKINENSFTATA